MNHAAIATKRTYAGLFMVTLATLMYEILLTRIFSVILQYHFAFVAVSVAMFGMTLGALRVYRFPRYFSPECAKHRLAVSALLFSGAIVFCLLIYLLFPFVIGRSLSAMYSIGVLYVVTSFPFVFSGICVCLALTKFPQQVSRLYAADLAGAALGCLLLIYLLGLTDGPTTVVGVALLASFGAVFFAGEAGSTRLKRVAFLWSLVLLGFGVFQAVRVAEQAPLLRLRWVKGVFESPPLYEKWNSFSRIRVFGDGDHPAPPFGWGLSPIFPPDRKFRQLSLDIDASALTVLTAFRGDLNDLEHLKYDVTSLAHYLRHDASVLVVGAGGGRDILSALAFRQRAVIGVDINQNIIDTVNQRFGDFTGHLDRIPGVVFVRDEARSYVARSKDRFDIIQISLIDTWAATAAGAFVLTENSLYTVEGWKIFLEHLMPQGILTVSRWYFRDRPDEVYRLVSLASTSLGELGVQNPRKHIVVVRRMRESAGREEPEGVGTMLVSREPFSEADLDTLEQVTRQMKFELILSPRFSLDPTFAAIASGKDLHRFVANFPLNIAAPTDDSPFFFHTLRLRNAFSSQLRNQSHLSGNLQAVSILVGLLITVLGLTLLCILLPLMRTTEKGSLKGALALLVFFSAIGLGYMLVEISQMERLMIFLGHPTYGLSVVLFALLLSSGLGSYSTERMGNPATDGRASVRLLLLISALIVFGMVTPYLISAFQASGTFLRILVAVIILFPLGVFMGMAFPLGMKIATAKSPTLTPWLWGINGATSVCASVLAIVIALSSGIAASFWTGFACYAVGFLAFLSARNENA